MRAKCVVTYNCSSNKAGKHVPLTDRQDKYELQQITSNINYLLLIIIIIIIIILRLSNNHHYNTYNI